ncbi:MAG: hypothetical protein WC552_05155 [Candidatus Omnitrophota bacterium]
MDTTKKNKTDDSDFEIGFCEGILKRSPDFIEALIVLGDLYTRKGLFEKGLEVDKRLASLRPGDGVILYNLACSYSLVNQIDASFAAIQQAVECGYDELEFLEKDGDLENLRRDSRFQKFLAAAKAQGPKRGQEKKKVQ